MLLVTLALVGFGFVAATVGVTAALCRFTSLLNGSIVIVGGAIVPVLLSIWAIYDASHLDVHSPPPGMLIIGELVLLAGTALITLFAAFLTVRFFSRASSRSIR